MSIGDPVQLGKISTAVFGTGGYQGAMFGLTLVFTFADKSQCSDFKGWWSNYPSHAEYTMEEWAAHHAETYSFIRQLMRDAKVSNFNDLVGKPIEAKFHNFNVMESWRILTEVL